MLYIGSTFANLRGQEENEPTSSRNNGIFFDAATEQVITVSTDWDESILNVHSLDVDVNKLTLRSRERGQIRWITFSADLQIASIQQEDTVVDFLLLNGEKITAEFRQTCKFKGAIILGILWIADRQIVFVTDAGCEFYQVNVHRKTLKMLKSYSLSVNWFSYYPPAKLFAFASGVPNNFLAFHCFQNNAFQNIGRLELDFGISPAKPRLLERDITIASLYGKICLLALNFEPANGAVMGLNIFEFSEEQPQLPKLKYFVRLDLLGLVGIQVIENIVIIHHKSQQKSLLFDVKISTDQPINSAPIQLAGKLVDHFQSAANSFLYNSAWKMSPNGFIIDMQLEIFTRIQLNLAKALELIENLEHKIQFLINRSEPKQELLELIHRIILRREMKFTRITQILEQILHNPNAEEDETQTSKGNKWTLPNTSQFHPLTASHNSILRTIFEPLYQNPEVDKKLLANLMIDFFRKLKQRKIPIQNHYTPELLLKIIADAKMWPTLQQFLQYRVVDDSKFLAFELISLSKECPALYQNALDMLNRRGNSLEIADVLLSRGHILEALNLISEEQGESQRLDKICLKLIAAAWGKYPTDRPLMFTVYSHLEKIGKLKSLALSGNEDFERFSGEFERLYGDSELKEAEMRFRMARLTSIRRGRRDSHFNESFTSTAGDENDQILAEIQQSTTTTDASSASTVNIADRTSSSSE